MPATSTAEVLASADRFIGAVTALQAAECGVVHACQTIDRSSLPASVLAALDAVDAAQAAIDQISRERLSDPSATVMPLG